MSARKTSATKRRCCLSGTQGTLGSEGGSGGNKRPGGLPCSGFPRRGWRSRQHFLEHDAPMTGALAYRSMESFFSFNGIDKRYLRAVLIGKVQEALIRNVNACMPMAARLASLESILACLCRKANQGTAHTLHWLQRSIASLEVLRHWSVPPCVVELRVK